MGDNNLKVIMYSHDGFGLGHVRRNLSIARHMVKINPASNVLVLAGTMPPGTDLPAGVDLIKLPSIMKSGNGVWLPRTLNTNNEKLKAIRSGIIEHIAREFRPDIFLVDYMPTGVWGELVPTLEYLSSSSCATHNVLGLREFLDHPESTRSQWLRDGTFEAITKYYSRIFVYGDREIFNTVENYGLDSFTNNMPVEYCGYVCSPPVSCKKSDMYRDLGLEMDRKLILVTGGGGKDAFPMMKKSLEAFRELQSIRALRGIFVAGPLMSQEDIHALHKTAYGLPVRIINHARNLYDFINAADLIVSMAGYNTLAEALGSGKKVLAIPRDGPSAEQKMRADTFFTRGYLETITLDQASPASMAKKINQMIDRNIELHTRLSVDGLNTVANRLQQLGGYDYTDQTDINMPGISTA